MKGRPVIETSRLGIIVDGVNLGDGATVAGVERARQEERYRTRGVHAMATSRYSAATLALSAPGERHALLRRSAGVRRRRGLPVHRTCQRCDRRADSRRSDCFQLPCTQHSLVPRSRRPLRIRLREKGHRGRAGRGLGCSAGHSAAAGRRRIRVDYRSWIEELRRHGAAGRSPRGIRGQARARAAGIVSLPAPLSRAGCQAPRNAGVIHRHHHHALAGRSRWRGSEYAGQYRHHLPTCRRLRIRRYFHRASTLHGSSPGAPSGAISTAATTPSRASRISRTWRGKLGFEYQVVEGLWRRWTDDRGARTRQLLEGPPRRDFAVGTRPRSAERRCATRVVPATERPGDRRGEDRFSGSRSERGHRSLSRDSARRGGVPPDGELSRGQQTCGGIADVAERADAGRRLRSRAPGAGLVPPTTPRCRSRGTWQDMATSRLSCSVIVAAKRHGRTRSLPRPSSRRHSSSTAPTRRVFLENPAVDLIKAVPSTWDETIVLPRSSIGEVAAFARRKGEEWFIAVLNGPEARTLRVDLKFLGARPYRATLVRDDPDNAAAERIERATLTRQGSITITLRPGRRVYWAVGPVKHRIRPASAVTPSSLPRSNRRPGE